MLCSSFAIDLPYRTAPFAPELLSGLALRLQPEGRCRVHRGVRGGRALEGRASAVTARCGVAAFPDALLLFSGENIGKLVLRVADARRRLAPEPRLVVRRGKRGGLFRAC